MQVTAIIRQHPCHTVQAVYEHYDLVIWSATSMKWIEVKMRELGVSTHAAYKLTALMDHRCMVTIHTARHGAHSSSVIFHPGVLLPWLVAKLLLSCLSALLAVPGFSLYFTKE